MNGANSRALLSVNFCKYLASLVFCVSWPRGVCLLTYGGEGPGAGMLVSEDVGLESCGA